MTSFELEDFDDYLAHHGILGQKWGIRRYQNPDGSLTEAGKKHYGRQIEKAKNKADNKPRSGMRHLHRERVFSEMVAKDPAYIKAEQKYESSKDVFDFYERDLRKKYGSNWYEKTNEKEERRYNENFYAMEDACTAYGRAWLAACNKYEPELLSAGLADIGVEDTEYGRQVLKRIAGEDELWAYKM